MIGPDADGALVVIEPVTPARPEPLDAVTIETFVAEHYRRLVGLAVLISGDADSAEDIVQTALERAWRSRLRLRDGTRLKSWLDTIVVREASRERRYRLRWRGRSIPARDDDDDLHPEPETPDTAAGRFPERTALRLAFEHLSPAHRAVVVLHLHAGYTVDETAAIVAAPRETVRSRLRTAREHLRKALEEVDR